MLEARVVLSFQRLVASVLLNDERFDEVVVEVFGQLHLAKPSVHSEDPRMWFLMNRRNVIRRLQPELLIFVSQRITKVQISSCCWDGIGYND